MNVMIAINEMEIKEIKRLCERTQIRSLYLFGSGTNRMNSTNKSDLDFIFELIKDEEGLSISGYDYFDLMFKK